MNVLSLFDGMSCGQIALNVVGIKYDNYYASEIDKCAIAQTMLNFPNTIQLGSVVDVDVSKLEPIDFLIGGSPCQSFSFAGKRKGMATKCDIEINKLEQYLELKQQGFEFEGQSYLFWEYMRILTDIKKHNPNVKFLLENVEMGSKWERILSEAIGIFGVHINSALVSAQNRKRIYWTNIRVKEVGMFGELYSDIPQPKDRGILLKDILDEDVEEKYYLSNSTLKNISNCKSSSNPLDKIFTGDEKMSCVLARGDGELHSGMKLISTNKDGLVKQVNPCLESGGKQPYQQNRVYDTSGISPALCANKADLLVTDNYVQWEGAGFDQDNRAYFDNGKSGTLDVKSKRQKVLLGALNKNQLSKFNETVDTTKHGCVTNAIGRAGSSDEYMDSISKIVEITSKIRRLTPTECARLQTIPDWYKWNCSDTQQYRMLGNGWTVDVIAHIFSFLK